MAPHHAWVGVLIVLLAACNQAGSSGSPEDAATAPAASAATTSAEASPSPGDSAAGAVPEGPIVPGEYTSDSTGATITFSVDDEGWQGAEDIEGVGFALITDQFGAVASVSVVPFPGDVFTDPCDPEAPTEAIDPSPESFMAWLREVEGVQADEPTDATVGDQPALRVDLTTELPPDCLDPPWIFLWALPTVGDFHFADGETVRVWAVQADDATVAIVAEADQGVDTDAFLAAAEEIVGSMTVD